MKAFSIEWHEECLENRKKSAEGKRREALRTLKDLNRLLRENEFYEAQIKEAKKRGKDSFDSDKFMTKRRR